MKKILAAFVLTVFLSGCADNAVILPENQTVTESKCDIENMSIEKDSSDAFTEKSFLDVPIEKETREILENIIGKKAVDLSEDELEFLLNTPVLVLHKVLDFPLLFESNWSMYGNLINIDKIPGLTINIGYEFTEDLVDNIKTGDEEVGILPCNILIFCGLVSEGNDNFPINYTFKDAMDIWGETDIEEFQYAGGYNGEGSSMLKQLVYQKENLEFQFSIDYNYVFKPEEEHILAVDLINIKKISPIQFLNNHIDVQKELSCNNIAYQYTEEKRNNASNKYYHVSAGIYSEEKFTVLSHYYIPFDYSEIIKANQTGEDYVIWKK